MNTIKLYIARMIVALTKRPKRNIWLIGENLGKCARDNGYYFFDYTYHQQNIVDTYFVTSDACLDKKRLEFYGSRIVKQNSIRHYVLYLRSQYCIVSHGIRDAIPEICVKKFKNKYKPIVYLQHGIIRYKKLFYSCLSYNKSIIRFLCSSREEQKIVTTQMAPRHIEKELKFTEWKIKSHLWAKDYIKQASRQLPSNKKLPDEKLLEFISETDYLSNLKKSNTRSRQSVGFPVARAPITGLPRYDSLLREYENSPRNSVFTILVFPTWREYLSGMTRSEFEESEFFLNYSKFLSHPRVLELAANKKVKIKFRLHIERGEHESAFSQYAEDGIEILTQDDDLRPLVLGSDLLITDYSSLSWEFFVLGKATLFFHFDFDEFVKLRGTYAPKQDDWVGTVVSDLEKLVAALEKDITFAGRPVSAIIKHDIEITNKNCSKKVFDEILKIPKKIYFVVYNVYGVGGTVKTTINTANYLFEKGYNIEIISLRRTSKWPELGLHPGIKIDPLYDARRSAYSLRKAPTLKKALFFVGMRVLERFHSKIFCKGEDLYHMVCLAADVQLFRRIRRLDDCTVVSTIPSLNAFIAHYACKSVRTIGQEHKFFEAHSQDIKRKIEKQYPKLDILTVLTEDDRIKYKDEFKSLNVVVQPNGSSIPEKRNNYKNTSNHKKIIFLGRLVEQKGVDMLLQAFSVIAKEFPDWNLEIYGDGHLKESLENLVSEMACRSQVYLKRPVSDVDDVLSCADIVAVPSRFEPFGMVIIEAFSHSLPVVCFDIKFGPASLVRNNQNGVKVPAFDVAAYAQRLRELMCDSDMRLKLGKAANKDFLNQYTISRVGQKFETLLS